MANNRMYLVCTVCNEQLFLGKTLGVGGFYFNTEPPLAAFFDQHATCFVRTKAAEHTHDAPEYAHEAVFALGYEVGVAPQLPENWQVGATFHP